MCQKDKTKREQSREARTREPLSLNISEFGSAALIRAAQIRNDSRLLLHIEGKDTIAMDIKYHRSCYKNYVRPKQLAKLEEQNCLEEDERSESYNNAFIKVKEFVGEDVFTAVKAIPMSVLMEKYTSLLAEEGIDAMAYRSSKLKNRLVRGFGTSLSFHWPLNRNQSEIVYSSEVKTGEVEETVFMNTTSADGKQMTENDSEEDLTDAQEDESRQVYHTAKIIRSLLVNIKPTMPWPPSTEDIKCQSLKYLIFSII